MEEMLHTLLILERRTLVVQRIREKQGPKERRENVSLVIGLVTMLENVLSRRILPIVMTTTTTEGMEIKGKKGSREKGRLPPAEMINLSKGQETPGMRNHMLLIKEMNTFLYLPSLLHLHPTLSMSG